MFSLSLPLEKVKGLLLNDYFDEELDLDQFSIKYVLKSDGKEYIEIKEKGVEVPYVPVYATSMPMW